MITAVDTSVILDVLTDDPTFADRSESALRTARREGALVVSEAVIAEVLPAIGEVAVEELLNDWMLEFKPSTLRSATLAGAMLAKHLRRRKRRPARDRRVAADFLIGAHASEMADRLLTRDRGFYRDYFGDLVVMAP